MIQEVESPGVVLDPLVLREQSYLIARGVRPLAVLGHCSSDPQVMLRVATQIEGHAEPGCIPFVVDREDGCADFGCAAAAWAVDLRPWVALAKIPSEREARIMGLLLGVFAQCDSDVRRGARWTRLPSID